MTPTCIRSQQENQLFARCIYTCALTCALLMSAGYAQAHVFCVATATELKNALTDSSDGGMYSGEDNFVRIRPGTYMTGAAPFSYNSTSIHLLEVLGGYNAGCTATTRKAAQTILDGHNATGVLKLRSTNGTIAVFYLTLQNGQSGIPGAGLSVNYLTTVNASVNIAQNIIKNNHSSVSAGGLYASAAGSQFRVTTNLITGNSADGQYGAGYVTGYGPYTYLINNTVVLNTSSAVTNPAGGLDCAGTAPCGMYSNIFWNNTNCGVILENSGATMSDNDYGTRCGVAPAIDSGNLSVNPKFVDESGGDFHLIRASPLLGYAFPQGSITDLDGNAFALYGKIDVGAYAETIFINGFN